MSKLSLKRQISKAKPIKSLLSGLTKSGGRNNQGRITAFHRGGGHKRRYRKIDFRRYDLAGTVVSLEYDPNRSGYIAGIKFGKTFFYILAPEGLSINDEIYSGDEADIKIGHALPLKDIPIGTTLHNVEIMHGNGGQLIRSAGCRGQLLQKNKRNAIIRLPSGEQYVVQNQSFATIGVMSNPEHANRIIGKAGRSRWLSRRPVVRGVAMNPVDHPHGGGEGKTSGGRPSVTPWGKPTKGRKTRNIKKSKRKF
jgi:large subunit ribosomal protein L2